MTRRSLKRIIFALRAILICIPVITSDKIMSHYASKFAVHDANISSLRYILDFIGGMENSYQKRYLKPFLVFLLGLRPWPYRKHFTIRGLFYCASILSTFLPTTYPPR